MSKVETTVIITRNEKEKTMKKIFKSITLIVIATSIAVASACIASSATRENLDPEKMKVWVDDDIIYLEYPDGNVWAHEVK